MLTLPAAMRQVEAVRQTRSGANDDGVVGQIHAVIVTVDVLLVQRNCQAALLQRCHRGKEDLWVLSF